MSCVGLPIASPFKVPLKETNETKKGFLQLSRVRQTQNSQYKDEYRLGLQRRPHQAGQQNSCSPVSSARGEGANDAVRQKRDGDGSRQGYESREKILW